MGNVNGSTDSFWLTEEELLNSVLDKIFHPILLIMMSYWLIVVVRLKKLLDQDRDI